MNPVFRQIIRFNKNVINEIPKNNLTEEDIDLAISLGYKYNISKSPLHLLKFKKIADQLIEQGSIDENEFYSLITNNYFKSINELFSTINNNKMYLLDESKEHILIYYIKNNPNESIPEYIINNENMIYHYIEIHPEYLKQTSYEMKNYGLLAMLLKKYNVLFSELHPVNQSLKLFEIYIVYNSKAFLEPISFDILKDYNVRNRFNSLIYTDSEFMLEVLRKDFSRISLFDKGTQYDPQIFEIFKENIRENIKYLQPLSNLFPLDPNEALYEGAPIEKKKLLEQIKEIKELIQKENLIIDGCSWPTIYMDKQLILKLIEKNPKLLFNLDKLHYFHDSLTYDEQEKICEIIRKNNLIFSKTTSLLLTHPKIFKEALKINPYIIDNIENDFYVEFDEEVFKILENSGYKINKLSPKKIFNCNYDFYLKQLKENPEIITYKNWYILGEMTSSKIDNSLDIYNIFNNELTEDLIIEFKNPLLILEGLKEGIINLNHPLFQTNFFESYKPFINELITYVLNNYSIKQINDLAPTLINQIEKLKEDVLFQLNQDFSNCMNIEYNYNMSDNTLKEISKLYFLNYEENKKYYDSCELVYRNYYINLYENIKYNRPIKIHESHFKNNDIFIDEYRKGNIEITEENAFLLFKTSQDISDIVSKNPWVLDYYKNKNESLDQMVISLFKEGKYRPTLNTNDYIIDLLIPHILSDNSQDYNYKYILIKKIYKTKDKQLLKQSTLSKKIILTEYEDYTIYDILSEFDEEELIEIIESNPQNILIYNRERPKKLKEKLEKIKANDKILEIYKNKDLILNKSIKENPEQIIYGTFEYNDILSNEEFFSLHNKFFEYIKTNSQCLFVKNYDLLIYKDKQKNYDKEVLEYLSKNNRKLFFDVIEQIILYNDSIDEYIENLVFTFTKEEIIELVKYSRLETRKTLISKINDNDMLIEILCHYTTSNELSEEILKNKSITFTKEQIKQISRNSILVLHVLRQDISNYQYLNCKMINEEYDEDLLKIFEDNHLIDPSIHPIFENCKLIKNKYNIESPVITEELLKYYGKSEMWLVKRKTGFSQISDLIIESYKINPKYLKYFDNEDIAKEEVIEFLLTQDLKYDSEYFSNLIFERPHLLLQKLLRNDFLNTIDKMFEDSSIAGIGIENVFRTLDFNMIIELALKNNYVLSEKSYNKIKESKEILLNSVKINPLSVVYGDKNIDFSEEEKKYISDIIINNNIDIYDDIYTFMYNNIEFLNNQINKNIYTINKIPFTYLNIKTKKELLKLIKNKISNNDYLFSLDTPKWILDDRDLLFEAYKVCPQLIDKYTELRFTIKDCEKAYNEGIQLKDNPYEIINYLLHNIELIDTYGIRDDLIYPKDLMEKLIDKLIENNYLVTSKTPKKLLLNYKFLYYALSKNMDIEDKYIKGFITFENLVNTKDIDLFKRYIQKGYGNNFRPYIDILGFDQAFEFVSTYGKFLNVIDFANIDSKEQIIDQIIKSIGVESYIVDSKYPVNNEELINGIKVKNKIYSIDLKNRSLFKYLVEVDSTKIELYLGAEESIYKSAVMNGYHATKEKLDINPNFKKSPSIIKNVILQDIESIYLYEGKYSNEFDDLFKITDLKGKKIIPEPENIEKLPFIHLNDKLIKEAVEYDVNNVYLYKGKYSKEFDDLFKITDSKGKKIIPEPENIEKLPFIHLKEKLMREAVEYDINNMYFYKGNDLSYFVDILDITDSKGKKLELTFENLSRLPIFNSNEKIFKRAIEYDPKNIILFNGQNDELSQLALENGYVPEKKHYEMSESLRKNEYIFKYALKHNINEVLIYYLGENEELIDGALKGLLTDKFDALEADPKTLKKYRLLWNAFSTFESRKRLLVYFNNDIMDIFENIDIDYYLVLKYGLNNIKMDELIKIIDNDKLSDFCNFYQIMKSKYLRLDNNAHGVDMFLKLARFYNRYPNLIEVLKNTELKDNEVANLISLINSDIAISNINTLEDIRSIEQTRIKAIVDILNEKEITKPLEVKELILRYVFDINYDKFINILTNYINFDTLDKILKKAQEKNNVELLEEATSLKVLLKVLEETVNATDNVDSLKSLLQAFLTNSEEINSVRNLYYNLEERIRNIYELDAIITLTDIDEVAKTKLREKVNEDDPDIIELENSEYAIYAHCTKSKEIKEFVDGTFNGRVTTCVSPISNIGKRLYSDDNLILGYTKLPRGSFIGSSNRNMGSNCFIGENNYEPRSKDSYYHLEFKDSSSLTPAHHPETLLYRDGLLPTCIILKGYEPTQIELDARKELSELLGYEIPFVHTQSIGNIATLKDNEDIYIIESETEEKSNSMEQEVEINDYKTDIDRLIDIKDKVLKLRDRVDNLAIEKDDIYDLIKMKIGGSHDIFKCHIKDREGVYYLKPGYRKDGAAIDPYRSEAMLAAYKIQKIANPENAVYVDLVEVDGQKLNPNIKEKIKCSVIEVIPNSTSYNGWGSNSNAQLTSKELSAFMQECISDYLLFSYDTKAENFLRDENGNVYGIDKEQALKFILHPKFATQNEETGEYTFDTSFSKHNSQTSDFNGCGLIYVKIFDKIINGKIDFNEENLEDAMSAIDRVESISDEEYMKIFKGFIDTFVVENSPVSNKIMFYESKGYEKDIAKELVKKDLYNSLLARKHNLRDEFIKYIIDIINKYGISKGVDVTEWINKIQSTKVQKN